jgi:hypothetical protein
MLRVFTKTCRSDSNLITIGWKKRPKYIYAICVRNGERLCISVSLSVANCLQKVTINLKKYNFI